MKKTVLLILFALLAAGLSSEAQADLFFGIRGGAERLEIDGIGTSALNADDSVNDFIFGGFVGYHYSFFRMEAEYMYHNKRSFEGDIDVESQTIMGNLYFSPPMKSVVKPYLMGGVGAALHDTTVGTSNDSNADLAWHIGLGLELEFTENVFLEAGARYVNLGDAEFNSDKYEMCGFNYFGGLRFEY